MGLEHKYPSVFYACAFPVVYETAGMFGDARYAFRHAGFLFRLPPAQIAMLWVFLLASVSFIATFFWRRAKTNRASAPVSLLPTAARARSESGYSQTPRILSK